MEQVQFYNHSRTDTPDIVWLKFTSAWAGTTCNSDWGWFNAKENPAFVATALAARASNTPVLVYVDDTYAKLAGYCLIVLIGM